MYLLNFFFFFLSGIECVNPSVCIVSVASSVDPVPIKHPLTVRKHGTFYKVISGSEYLYVMFLILVPPFA